MSWSNAILNVNGRENEDLLDLLRIVFRMHSRGTCKGYAKSKTKGLVLLWSLREDAKDQVAFPSGLTAEQVYPLVVSYLDSPEAAQVELDGWDSDADHDGHNGIGWRLYVEDWGHVDHCWASICAIKRVFIWYGK